MRAATRAGARLILARPAIPFFPAVSVRNQALQRARISTKSSSSPHLRIGNWNVAPEAGQISNLPQHRDISGIWLRDNCRCSTCVNQDTMQRNFNTFDIPQDIEPKEVVDREDGLHVTWPDGHRSSYTWDFINHYACFTGRPVEIVRNAYFGAEAALDPPTIQYKKAMLSNDSGMAKLTAKIRKHGFVFVQGTPYEDPEDTKRLLERIGPIRETHYGGFYDFTPDLAKADTAYTNLALPAHTDTTYFTEPAGLQAFHLLSHKPAPGAAAGQPDSDPDVASGGKSLLVDGFHAAKILRTEHRWAYDVLSGLGLPWHASGNKGVAITPRQNYPVFESENYGALRGRYLQRIRWNNDDRGVVPRSPAISPQRWYEAARIWDNILRRKDLECWVQLEPGTTLIFDNWRVLHGRSAFTGIRRICGAYINRDDFISRWRNTNFNRESVMKHVIG